MSITPQFLAEISRPSASGGSDSALFEVIPEDELPIDCCPASGEVCKTVGSVPNSWTTTKAVVRVSASSGYERRPLCAAHAHVVFAEWMVGI
jgi:hypothetical protein